MFLLYKPQVSSMWLKASGSFMKSLLFYEEDNTIIPTLQIGKLRNRMTI